MVTGGEESGELGVQPSPSQVRGRVTWWTETGERKKNYRNGSSEFSVLSLCLLFLRGLAFPGTFLSSAHQGTKAENKSKEKKKKTDKEEEDREED